MSSSAPAWLADRPERTLRLEGRTAVVTGGARGMGASHARVFVREGARVVLVDRDVAAGSELARDLGADALFVEADVTSAADWARVISRAEQHFAPVDVLINNAGILRAHSVLNVTEEDYRRVVEVNQLGVFLGMQAVIPAMRQLGRGSIVNIGSTAAMVGARDYFAYTSAKWAVRGMSKAAALALAPHGIRVNAVHPGDVETEMTAEGRSSGEITTDGIPMKRFGRPEEISQAVLYLASDASSYLTGTDLVVDGGFTAA